MTPSGISSTALSPGLVDCRRCPRLVAHRERVAREKVARHRDEEYWGRPVPGWGDPTAQLLVLGLAPGAHGGNRTGRAFTGDGAGAFLSDALRRAGALAPCGTLRGTWVTNAVKCAPPANRPTGTERDTCAGWLADELRHLPVRVVVALGAFAWDAALRHLTDRRPRPPFRHGARADAGGCTVLAAYHPSRQNTNTGRLTAAMLDEVLAVALDMTRAV